MNWNILIFILAITLSLWVFVVITSFKVTRGGYWSLSLAIAIVVLSVFSWRSQNKRRDIIWHMQDCCPVVIKHTGSVLNMVLTLLISGTIFTLISYVFEIRWGIPMYFSIPWIAFGLMMTLTKNITTHEILGNLLLIRLGIIEIVIPIANIQSVTRTREFLMVNPKEIKNLPRKYRATTSYFGKRLLIRLKRPQKILMMGIPPVKNSRALLIDVDQPNLFLKEIKARAGAIKEGRIYTEGKDILI